MNPSEWARAREVFDGALARERDQRSAFLDEACEGKVMSGWMQDVRYALRQLLRSPGFASTAIVTLRSEG